MALKVKAVERNLKFQKDDPGIWRYVMQPELYSSLAEAKVIKEAALRSGVSLGVTKACWDAAGEVIKAWLPEGHSVPLPGLGTARFGLSAKTVANVNDVKSSLIKTRRIVFTPSVELKNELKNTAIVITCYDRTGKEVERVTSADPGTVEETNGEDTNGTSQTVEAPTISGETPFSGSTEVTMTGPEGAEIRYTTDGSTPTAESTLYSAAITLSDSATVKAIAIKDGTSSEVSSKEFTKESGGGETIPGSGGNG